MAVAIRPVIAAVIAARKSFRTRKKIRNAAGVSLIAAARPTPMPRGHRGFGARLSTATSAIRMMLIWPKRKGGVAGGEGRGRGKARGGSAHPPPGAPRLPQLPGDHIERDAEAQ